jgi:hypothetical protein
MGAAGGKRQNDRNAKQRMTQGAAVPTRSAKTNDERNQVQTERYCPEQRDRCDVLADDIGDGEQGS